jgi:hypothetical protein
MLPPAPNHGFLISLEHPGMEKQVSYRMHRLIDIADEYDARELGSAKAYLEFEAANTPELRVVQSRAVTFHGLPAVRATWHGKNSPEIREELIVYRAGDGIIYDLTLKTRATNHTSDAALFQRVENGFHVFPVPPGPCMNE